MMAIDTRICAQESRETLLLQQKQLKDRRRVAQMFPARTVELDLPDGLHRYENDRGTFHFWPSHISPRQIDELSEHGRENEILNLGPFSKSDIAARAMAGEPVTCVAEYASCGSEIRCAAATEGTVNEQVRFFEATKEPGSTITIGIYPHRVTAAWEAMNG